MSSTQVTQVELPLPRVSAVVALYSDGKQVAVSHSQEIPREVMDAYKQVLGTAEAKVSVSSDMSTKEYGTGVSSMCSITLSCSQDEASINRAMELASELARDFAQQNLVRAESQFKEMVAQKTFATPR